MDGRDSFWVRFWGVRGSFPCPGPATARYGGHTSCVEMRAGPVRLVFDAGTGLAALGREWQRNRAPVEAHVFLTHLHLDHITGLALFAPAFDPESRITVWGPSTAPGGLKAALARIFREPYLPFALDSLVGIRAFRDLRAGEVVALAPAVGIATAPLRHPGGAIGYRVSCGGRSACYVTDTEHPPEGRDGHVVALIADADLVIYDSTFTDEEYPAHRGWGHSTWQEGVRLCEAAAAGRLVAFHHDPAHDDGFLDGIQGELERVRPGSLVAREGLVLRV